MRKHDLVATAILIILLISVLMASLVKMSNDDNKFRSVIGASR